MRSRRSSRRGRRPPGAADLVDQAGPSLLDLVDNLLNRGVLLDGELILALADVDLVYVRLSALLCAADRLFPKVPSRR